MCLRVISVLICPFFAESAMATDGLSPLVIKLELKIEHKVGVKIKRTKQGTYISQVRISP